MTERDVWGNPRPMTHRVWHKDYYSDEDDGLKLYAIDSSLAAEKFIEQMDWDGADGMTDHIEGVEVTDLSTGTIRTYSVTGEVVPQYSATEEK